MHPQSNHINYYEPPVHESDQKKQEKQKVNNYHFKSTAATALITMSFNYLSAALMLGLFSAGYVFQSKMLINICLLLYIISTIVSSIVYLIWIHGSNKNADYFCRGKLSIKSGWAVGWYFMPIANLFMPFKSFREMILASERHEVPIIINIWWIVSIASMIFGAFGERISIEKIPLIVSFICFILFPALTHILTAIAVNVLTRSQTYHEASLQSAKRIRQVQAIQNTDAAPLKKGHYTSHAPIPQTSNSPEPRTSHSPEPQTTVKRPVSPMSQISQMSPAPTDIACSIPDHVLNNCATINNRFSCIDENENWGYGHPNHCIDRKTQQPCLCVRIPIPSNGLNQIASEVKRIFAMRIPNLITPSSVCSVKSFEDPMSTSNSTPVSIGDSILIFGKDIGLSLLDQERRGTQLTTPPFPHLQRLAQIFENCHKNELPIHTLDYRQLRIHENDTPTALAIFPFIGDVGDLHTTPQATSILASNYPDEFHPTRLLAAIATVTLSPLAKRKIYMAHNGQHTPLSTLPAKTNGLIANILNPHTNITSIPKPTEFIALIENSFCVDFDRYLSKAQQDRLLNEQELDEKTILKIIIRTLRKDGISTPLVYHQNLRPISDDELKLELVDITR